MKRIQLARATFVALLVGAPLLAGHGEDCNVDTQVCLNQMANSLRARGWVGLELDLDDHGKSVVTFVWPDSPAMDAGIVNGDVLVALNGIEINDENRKKLAEAKKALRVGKTISYTIERAGCCHKAGGMKEVQLRLAEIPDDVLAKWIGEHMIGHAVITVAEN